MRGLMAVLLLLNIAYALSAWHLPVAPVTASLLPLDLPPLELMAAPQSTSMRAPQ